MKFVMFVVVVALAFSTSAFAQIPDLRDIAIRTFDSRPADVVLLRRICDQTDALRSQFGEDDSRVQDGEMRANALKGMFTRRIALAVAQVDPRFGLRLKQSGAHAVRPNDGLSLATDVLLWRDGGQVIDVMSDRNASWGMVPGDVQPVSQWVQPLPEVEDAPQPPPFVMPSPDVLKPPPAVQPPTPSAPSGEVVSLLQQIINLQQSQFDAIIRVEQTALDTNVHVKNMDRTLTQTLGSISIFVGKYIAPAIGGWYVAHMMNTPAPAVK